MIGGKLRLQRVGDKLDEFRLELVFHGLYCDPEVELVKLRQAMQLGEARQFVLGNGAYKGWFVITDLTATSRQTDKVGALVALDAAVTLREYVEPKTLKPARRRPRRRPEPSASPRQRNRHQDARGAGA